jgi:hypothetical protein
MRTMRIDDAENSENVLRFLFPLVRTKTMHCVHVEWPHGAKNADVDALFGSKHTQHESSAFRVGCWFALMLIWLSLWLWLSSVSVSSSQLSGTATSRIIV